jgi:hypothetical protein
MEAAVVAVATSEEVAVVQIPTAQVTMREQVEADLPMLIRFTHRT